MEEENIIVGLDIGTTKIACFVGIRAENNKVKILGYGKNESAGVVNGVVRNVEYTANAIKKAVDEAANQANIEIEEVWVGIAGQHIKSRPSQGGISIPSEHKLITQDDVDRLINDQYNMALNPGEQIIHIIPQQYIVDNESLPLEYSPVGVAGKTLSAEFYLVTANVQNLKHIQYAVEMAGLSIKGVVLEPIASSLAVLSDSDIEAGVALVDIGGGTTDIAIFHDHIIRNTTVLPLAGNAITDDIREGCKLLKKVAESLKVKFGSCLVQAVSENEVIAIPGLKQMQPQEISVRTLANIINARTKMILEQVNYVIEQSGLHSKLIAGIALTGGGAQLKNIKELCEFLTTINTRIGTPNEHISPDSVSIDEISHPMFATGIGLVIYGLQQTELSASKETTDNKDEEEPEQEHTIKTDIFEDMPETPTPTTQTPPNTSNVETGKKNNWVSSLSSWLNDLFTGKGGVD